MAATDEDTRSLVTSTFRAFFRQECPIDRVRDAVQRDGFDRPLWDAFRELGGDVVAVEDGGGDLLDAAIIGVECGRRLAPMPYAETVAALRLSSRLGLPDCRDELLSVVDLGDGHRGSSVGAIATTALLLDHEASECRMVSLDRQGAPLPNLAGLPFGFVADGVHTKAIAPLREAAIAAWRADLRILRASVLLGAGLEALNQVTQHVKERRQFDRPLGSFQAVAQRLATCATQLRAAELLVHRSAELLEQADLQSYWSAVALTASSDAAQLTAREALQFFGGYGYSLEYDIHLYLRYITALRVMALEGDLALDAAPTTSWPERAERLEWERGAGGCAAEVSEFLEQATTPAMIDNVWRNGTIHSPEIHHAMAARGWIGRDWDERGDEAEGDLWEALSYHRVPVDLLEITEMGAWVVLKSAQEDLKARVLPAVRAGEMLISLGYSEPDAGSDVAAATTSAALTNEGTWIVNGSKIFTTGAHVADEVLLLVRTGPPEQKHRNLTMFLVPMSSPGIDVQPIRTFGGERTNTVYFNDVVVDDGRRVSDEGMGWGALLMGLEFERTMMGSYVGRAQRVMDDLRAALADDGRAESPVIRARLAELNVRLEAARAVARHVRYLTARGEPVGAEASMTKILATEVFKDLAYVGLDLAGPRSLLTAESTDAPVDGRLEHWFRHSQVSTIYGGANEIQRDIIARQVLKLPRSS